MDMDRIIRVIRGEDEDVEGKKMVEGWKSGREEGRIGNYGRYYNEDRRIWINKIIDEDVKDGLRWFREINIKNVGSWDNI